jgi:hypothetical protein
MQSARGRLAARPSACQARPGPVFGALHQAGPQRVAFDVTQHGQEVIVLRDRERLEAILINMAAAGLW